MKRILHRIKNLTFIFCALTMLALPSMASAADTKNPRDQTLEEKLEMQEQRIRILEKRLREMEAAMLRKTEKETAATPAPTPAPAPETAKAPAPEPAHTEAYKAETSEKFPGSWPMFGTDMRIKLGGYLKADLLYDFDGTTDKYQFLMSTIPVEGTPEHENGGYISFFARETRFNIDVRRVTPGAVPLSAFVEGDFWSSGNQFRLRHAYMTVGDFLIGQTWTTLSFLESLPFIIDFGGGDALFGGRAAQIRYTKKINDQWKLALALENLNYPGIENPNNFGGKASNQLPLLALRADYKWQSTWLVLGSSIAQLRWDGGATGPSDEALQIDGMVGVRQYLGTNNYVTCNISYGEGSGENILAFAGADGGRAILLYQYLLKLQDAGFCRPFKPAAFVLIERNEVDLRPNRP